MQWPCKPIFYAWLGTSLYGLVLGTRHCVVVAGMVEKEEGGLPRWS